MVELLYLCRKLLVCLYLWLQRVWDICINRLRLDFYPQSRSPENLHSDDLSTVYPICFTDNDIQVTI